MLALPPSPNVPWQALIAPELARKEPPSLQGEMWLLEASLSPAVLAVGVLPLLWPQQTDVAILLSVQGDGARSSTVMSASCWNSSRGKRWERRHQGTLQFPGATKVKLNVAPKCSHWGTKDVPHRVFFSFSFQKPAWLRLLEIEMKGSIESYFSVTPVPPERKKSSQKRR